MWLYLPSQCSPCAQELEDSISESDSSWVEEFEQFVTWRGGSIPRKSWPHVWKMVFSSLLLYGLTSRRSTLDDGVQSWIEALWWAAILASRGAHQESDLERQTLSTFGLMFCECLPSAGQGSPSSRTSPGTSRKACKKCSKTWPSTGSMRNGVCTARQGLERPTSGAASSSSPSGQTWPTPTVKGNYNKAGKWAKSGDGLATAVQKVEGRGRLNSAWIDWLIGLPIDWTANAPLAMQSYQRWLDAHLPSFPNARELI